MSVPLTSSIAQSTQTTPTRISVAKVGSVFKDALDRMLQGMATGTAAHAGIRPDQSGGTLDAQARTGHSVSLKV